jgi:hypothetical protein
MFHPTLATCRPSVTTTRDAVQLQSMSRLTEQSIWYNWCVTGHCVHHNNVIAYEEVQKRSNELTEILSDLQLHQACAENYRKHLAPFPPLPLPSRRFHSIPFQLPTLHALPSSDLHCATHLYLTNRYLITWQPFYQVVYDIDTAMTIAMQIPLQEVYRLYTDQNRNKGTQFFLCLAIK